MRAKKRDRNEKGIVDALESIGAQVWRELPCDLLVRYRKQLFLLEVKDESVKKPRKDQPKQNAFLAQTETPVVRTPLAALKAIGAFNER